MFFFFFSNNSSCTASGLGNLNFAQILTLNLFVIKNYYYMKRIWFKIKSIKTESFSYNNGLMVIHACIYIGGFWLYFVANCNIFFLELLIIMCNTFITLNQSKCSTKIILYVMWASFYLGSPILSIMCPCLLLKKIKA